MTIAKRRAVDRIRRNSVFEKKIEELGHELDTLGDSETPDFDAAFEPDIGDDLLRLIFTACHPVLSSEARVALTLRLLGGLTTDEIARAFLVPEPTVAQRMVRAKKTIAEKRVPYQLPSAADLSARLTSVLEIIYLVFNEGYSATSGDDWMRPGLCEDALRLGRILAGLIPDESEVHAPVALMEIQASRSSARRAARRADAFAGHRAQPRGRHLDGRGARLLASRLSTGWSMSPRSGTTIFCPASAATSSASWAAWTRPEPSSNAPPP
jgi:predicted RNA polymerase sigma factor